MEYIDYRAMTMASPYERPERHEPRERMKKRQPGYYGIGDKAGEYVPYEDAEQYALEEVGLLPIGPYTHLQIDAIDEITRWYFSDPKEWEKVDE